MENSTVAVIAENGWFDNVVKKLRLEGVLKKLNLTPNRLAEVVLYLGIGFLSGFLFKKYAKYLFIAILTIVGLVILQQFGFVQIAINWEKVQGIQPMQAPLDASIWTVYWEWIKANFAIVLSFSIGFFVGFKVG